MNPRVKYAIRRGSTSMVRTIDLGDVGGQSDSDSSDESTFCGPNDESQADEIHTVQGGPTSMVADQAINKLVLENTIFLKAALQLLDQRDRSLLESSSNSMDIILSGKLKKATAGTLSRVWKDKFLELRHGSLSYEDITGWGQKSNKKTIQLLAGKVLCRHSEKYHGHVFEIRDLDSNGQIVHHHNGKKLFMAETNEEMMRWIESLRTAVIGSAGDFEPNNDTKSGSGGEESQMHTVYSDESEHKSTMLEDWRPLHKTQMGSSDSIDSSVRISSIPKYLTSSRKIKRGNHISSEASVGARSFANDMKRFEFIKDMVSSAATTQGYQECLLDQALDEALTIPVSYVKKFLKNEVSPRDGMLSGSTDLVKEKTRLTKEEKREKRKHGRRIRKSVFSGKSYKKSIGDKSDDKWSLTSKATSIENSQAWKDLFRDSTNINGDIVNGGVEGPEAMIGALVRHILLKVQIMREKWVSSYDFESNNNTSSSLSNKLSCQGIAFEKSRILASTYADLDEGQALSIARDVLLSCNRTESGGDTYCCIKSLLCNDNFAVLTPHACDVEPIEIIVDIAESAQRRSANRRRGHHSDHQTVDSRSLSDSCSKSVKRIVDGGDNEAQAALRDSTTVESDMRSENSLEQNMGTVPQSHYPESVLTAAAAKVKGGGRCQKDEMSDYYGAEQIVMKSDIPGASAIPSNILLMKEVSRRKKRLTEPGYIERSDSDVSSRTSLDTNSIDSENKSVENRKHGKPTGDIHDIDFGTNEVENACVTPPSHTTPVYHVNIDDDATLAVSELTMDTMPSTKKGKRKSSVSSLLKNFGFSSRDQGESPSRDKHGKSSSINGWTSKRNDGQMSNVAGGIMPSPSPFKKNDVHFDETNSIADGIDEEETAAQSMCIKIQVIVRSKYRLCNLDPQDNDEDTWANVTGEFHQHFFLKSNSNGRPAVSDRFVTIKVDDPSLKY